jgi:hypothetical protein
MVRMNRVDGFLACAVAAAVAALALVVQTPPLSAQTSEPRIVWRVDNPFRLFIDSADTEAHRATYEALSDDEKQQPVLAAERALAERHADGWAAHMFANTCWNAAQNAFACPQIADYAHPKAHTIRAHVPDLPDADSVDCTWLTTPHGGAKRGAALRVACNTPVLLEIPYPAGAKVSVEVGGRVIAASDVRVKDLFVVGLGDSFASGEGNPDVPVRFSRERTADYGLRRTDQALIGYPARVGAWSVIGDKAFVEENARWMDQACHRSLYSHQLRAALQLAIEDTQRAVTYAGLSCSGAETTQGLFLRYKGHEWVPNPPALSQLSAAADVQCGATAARTMDFPEAYHLNDRIPDLKGLVLKKCDAQSARRIDLVFLSIGGNDIGFARLVANAVLADQSSLRSLGGWFGQVHGFKEAIEALDRLDDRYKTLNRALHNILHIPWNESDRIVLTAYPPMSVMEDGRSQCPDGQAGMTILPDFQLSEAKAREGETAAQRMLQQQMASARSHGWSLVDAHVREFRGRGLCAGWTDSAFSSADDLRLPRKINGGWEPYNPAEWRAYASRQRWFRTPNDAFMTGNFHVSQSMLQTVLKNQGYEWVQLLLAATYSGAFHPTAEGHAAIADAVVRRARAVLERYDRAPGSSPRAQR